jgi:release factor glutamine methyltransferase
MPSPAAGRPQTQSERLRAACLLFRQAGLADARLEVEMLYAAALGIERRLLLCSQDLEPTPEQLATFDRNVLRRLQGEPVAYIEGWRGFFGLEFRVDERVLIPRADSECLVETALAFLPDNRPAQVLDVGTGSGCLLLAVLHHRALALGVALDRSAGALEVARSNAAELNLQPRVRFLQGAWLAALAPGSIDLILANPPYVEPAEKLGPGVAEFEPHLALFTPCDQPYFAYEAIYQNAAAVLKPGGRLLFEVGRGRASKVASMASRFGLKVLQTVQDLGGIERVIECERPPA